MACSCISGHCNNSVCSSHAAACANSYPFSAMAAGQDILAAHQTQFRNAINSARSRQGSGAYPFAYTPAAGQIILAAHYSDVSNGVASLSWSFTCCSSSHSVTPPTVGTDILASKMTSYKNEINSALNECYCNFNCTCDLFATCVFNCGCNYV